ncbi:MAG: hypothetical protein ITG02_15195 [Patulibacter sp.]|nr:hypothetical protein [Patulibacter sp.]
MTVAGLLLAGPRAHAHRGVLWRDIDLGNGRMEIGRSKTDGGLREIHILPLLRRELSALAVVVARGLGLYGVTE